MEKDLPHHSVPVLHEVHIWARPIAHHPKYQENTDAVLKVLVFAFSANVAGKRARDIAKSMRFDLVGARSIIMECDDSVETDADMLKLQETAQDVGFACAIKFFPNTPDGEGLRDYFQYTSDEVVPLESDAP